MAMRNSSETMATMVTSAAESRKFNATTQEAENIRALPYLQTAKGGLTCPFRRRNRKRFNVREYPACALRPFLNLTQVCQHIIQAHTRPNWSNRGQPNPPESSEGERRTLGRIGPHTAQDPEDGIGRHQVEYIHVLSSTLSFPQLTDEQKWEMMWQCLFPHDSSVGFYGYYPVVEDFEVEAMFDRSIQGLESDLELISKRGGTVQNQIAAVLMFFQKNMHNSSNEVLMSENLQEIFDLMLSSELTTTVSRSSLFSDISSRGSTVSRGSLLSDNSSRGSMFSRSSLFSENSNRGSTVSRSSLFSDISTDGSNHSRGSLVSESKNRPSPWPLRSPETEKIAEVTQNQQEIQSQELRISHNLTERKRRIEMKELFEQLGDLLPLGRGTKVSKGEILSKAIAEIERLNGVNELVLPIHMPIDRRSIGQIQSNHPLASQEKGTQQPRETNSSSNGVFERAYPFAAKKYVIESEKRHSNVALMHSADEGFQAGPIPHSMQRSGTRYSDEASKEPSAEAIDTLASDCLNGSAGNFPDESSVFEPDGTDISEDEVQLESEKLELLDMILRSVFEVDLDDVSLPIDRCKDIITSMVRDLDVVLQGSSDGASSRGSGVESGGTSIPPSLSSPSRPSDQASNSSKRQKGGKRSGSNSNGEDLRTKVAHGEDAHQHLGLKLSCPYRRRNPEVFHVRNKYSCSMTYYTSIAKLRQHIYSTHKSGPQNGYLCNRCKESFTTRAEMQQHSERPVTELCEAKSFNPLNGIDIVTANALISRKRKSMQDVQAAWTELWGLLFPDDTTIKSYDYKVVMEHLDLSKMYLDSLPELSSRLERIGANLPLGELVVNVEKHFLDVLSRCDLEALVLARDYSNDQSRSGESGSLLRAVRSSHRATPSESYHNTRPSSEDNSVVGSANSATSNINIANHTFDTYDSDQLLTSDLGNDPVQTQYQQEPEDSVTHVLAMTDELFTASNIEQDLPQTAVESNELFYSSQAELMGMNPPLPMRIRRSTPFFSPQNELATAMLNGNSKNNLPLATSIMAHRKSDHDELDHSDKSVDPWELGRDEVRIGKQPSKRQSIYVAPAIERGSEPLLLPSNSQFQIGADLLDHQREAGFPSLEELQDDTAEISATDLFAWDRSLYHGFMDTIEEEANESSDLV